MNGGEMIMTKDNKDIIQHGVNAAKAKAKDSKEKQYAEELSSELSNSSMKDAEKTPEK